MRTRIAVVAAGLVAAATLGAGAPTAQPAVPVALTKTCGPGYVHANLSWGEKCLRTGQFCKVANREYLRYGFICPPSGHLRRRYLNLG
jgi:hypothetical protein